MSAQVDQPDLTSIPEAADILKSKWWVPISKLSKDKQLITGVVLVPDQVDAHGDIIPAEVIEEAAHNFLAAYNSTTTMGLMHKDMSPPIDLVESYIAPMDMVLGSQTVKAGSWIITARVNDASIWKKVKEGKLTGFSIGGTAKVQDLQSESMVA
jgi:DNA adenine methylase